MDEEDKRQKEKKNEARRIMGIEEKIYEIINKHDIKTGKVDECIDELENYLSDKFESNNFRIKSDTDVFDSCGLDIYYIMVSWIDTDGLHLCGNRLTRC